uniref:TNF alpha induced protein 8 like 3 n=1 Tax=Felis catus TaxID=9685 RepID=A0ABI7ZW50_FELCA
MYPEQIESGPQRMRKSTLNHAFSYSSTDLLSNFYMADAALVVRISRSSEHQLWNHTVPILMQPWEKMTLELGPDVFSSKSLALQAQKKILSKIASKTMANMLIDDTSSEIFDELYKVTKEHTHSKKEAHKIMKDLIKVAIKIGILYRHNQFSQEEVVIVEKLRKKLNQTAMTIVSFYEVEYTFDRNVLSKLLHECKDLVHELVQRHLTPRTHGRINHVFNHFADVEFLSTLYSLDGDCRPNLKRICEGINKLLDEKVL